MEGDSKQAATAAATAPEATATPPAPAPSAQPVSPATPQVDPKAYEDALVSLRFANAPKEILSGQPLTPQQIVEWGAKLAENRRAVDAKLAQAAKATKQQQPQSKKDQAAQADSDDGDQSGGGASGSDSQQAQSTTDAAKAEPAASGPGQRAAIFGDISTLVEDHARKALAQDLADAGIAQDETQWAQVWDRALDLGMTGAYPNVVEAARDVLMARFTEKVAAARLERKAAEAKAQTDAQMSAPAGRTATGPSMTGPQLMDYIALRAARGDYKSREELARDVARMRG